MLKGGEDNERLGFGKPYTGLHVIAANTSTTHRFELRHTRRRLFHSVPDESADVRRLYYRMNIFTEVDAPVYSFVLL